MRDAVAGLPACPGSMRSCYTHAHADHITGLDDVRILNRIAGRPLDAFGTRGHAGRADAAVRLRVQAVAAAGLLPARCWCRSEIAAGDTIEAAGCEVAAVRAGPRLHRHAWPADRQLRLLDRRGRPGRCGARRAGGRGHLGGRLLPAPGPAQDARQSVDGAGLGASASAAPHGADAYGQRHGLGLAAANLPPASSRATTAWL